MARLIAIMILAMLVTRASAQTNTNTAPADLALIPEDAQLLEKSMLWGQTFTLRTGAGYRNNVLLSPTEPQGSTFVTEGIDYSLSRLPLDGWGLEFIVSGDDERYLANVPSDGNDFWLANLTLRKFLGANWEVGLESGANYLDEVDFVDTLIGPAVVEIQGEVLRLKPFVRRNLGTNWWAEFDFPTAREIFDAPLDNTWKYGPQLQLGFSDDRQNEVTLTYRIQEFDHDSWSALNADGTVDGTKNLSIIEQHVGVDWHRIWDGDSRWSTDTKLGFTHDEDNGGNFFNFDEYSLSERLRYENKLWIWTASVRGSYRDFPVQRTGLTTGPTLNEVLLHGTLRGEYRLKRWLKVYAEYNFERVLSNLSDIQYQDHIVLAGLMWEF